MNKPLYKVIYWSSRLLSIFLIGLLLLLSFDVFEIEDTFFNLLLGFIIHNIPVIILTIALIIAWKHEIVGAITFLIASLFLLIFLFVNSGLDAVLSALIIIIFGLIISALFFLNWKYKENT